MPVSPSVGGNSKNLSVISVLTGALVWGLIWYPYRVLAAWGLGGAAACMATYAVGLVVALVLFWRDLGVRPAGVLWAIAASAGITNIGFVWGTIHGDVVRVVLLFYTLPVWTVLFAWLILGERVTIAGAFVSLMALAGASLMLWNPKLGWPWPENAAEWVGLLAGMGFAMTNVLLQRAARFNSRTRLFYVLGGCVVVGFAAIGIDPQNLSIDAFEGPWVAGLVVLLGAVLVVVNLVVQYGIERLPANRVPIICLCELIVTGVSAWYLVGEHLGAKEMVGGGLIVFASVASARAHG